MTKSDTVHIPNPVLNDDGSWNTEGADTFSAGVSDKKDLLGVPIMITGVTYNADGDRAYATAEFYTEGSTVPGILNDGGTGIMKQLTDYLRGKDLISAKGEPPRGQRFAVKLVCRRGLRVSEYEGPGGRPAQTYYLA